MDILTLMTIALLSVLTVTIIVLVCQIARQQMRLSELEQDEKPKRKNDVIVPPHVWKDEDERRRAMALMKVAQSFQDEIDQYQTSKE